MKFMAWLRASVVCAVLSGCATIPAESITDLMASADTRVKNQQMKLDYRSLAACWDRNAEKYRVDFSNASHLTINEDEKFALIAHAWNAPLGRKLYYGSVIKVSARLEGGSYVDAYGNGHSADAVMNSWLKTIRDCDQGYIK